jgi:N-acetyl sugar amidotransferase
MKIYNEEELKKDPKANFGRPYQQCSISVMDTIADPDITFDEKGICNYYYQYVNESSKPEYSPQNRELIIRNIVDSLKNKKGKYHCIIGLSGGVDSSYLALFAKESGLNPLLVHFDYGWNSEEAVQNIKRIVQKTGFDLYTYVIDWSEFSNLQRSYFKASVLDLDVPADHMIFGALYKTAKKFKIQSILSGNNFQTEFTLPKSWNYNKFDLVNLKSINKYFENTPLNRLPKLGVWEQAYYQLVLGINNINILNYLDYNKSEIKNKIIEEFDWMDYGGKHHESIFTRFYQGYILPSKFFIDKRKAHFSNLIFSNQLSKNEALTELAKPHYQIELMKRDFSFVAKKLRFSEDEMEELLNKENIAHEFYGSDLNQRNLYFSIMKKIKPLTRIVKKIRS